MKVYVDKCNAIAKLPSPYGDGTQVINFMGALYKFSPPYGDDTLNISQNIVKWKN